MPQNVVNPAALIAANPCIEGQENEFTVTGRGGVPPSPNDALSSAQSPFSWVESSATDSVTDRGLKEAEIRTSSNSSQGGKEEEVVPAQGWVVNSRGDMTLVGYNPGNAADSRNPRQNSVCPPR